MIIFMVISCQYGVLDYVPTDAYRNRSSVMRDHSLGSKLT